MFCLKRTIELDRLWKRDEGDVVEGQDVEHGLVLRVLELEAVKAVHCDDLNGLACVGAVVSTGVDLVAGAAKDAVAWEVLSYRIREIKIGKYNLNTSSHDPVVIDEGASAEPSAAAGGSAAVDGGQPGELVGARLLRIGTKTISTHPFSRQHFSRFR